LKRREYYLPSLGFPHLLCLAHSLFSPFPFTADGGGAKQELQRLDCWSKEQHTAVESEAVGAVSTVIDSGISPMALPALAGRSPSPR